MFCRVVVDVPKSEEGRSTACEDDRTFRRRLVPHMVQAQVSSIDGAAKIDVERRRGRLLELSSLWVEGFSQVVCSEARDPGGGEDVIDSLVLGDGSVEERLERTPISDIRGDMRQTCPVLSEQGLRERIYVTDNDQRPELQQQRGR